MSNRESKTEKELWLWAEKNKLLKIKKKKKKEERSVVSINDEYFFLSLSVDNADRSSKHVN